MADTDAVVEMSFKALGFHWSPFIPLTFFIWRVWSLFKVTPPMCIRSGALPSATQVQGEQMLAAPVGLHILD